MSRTILLLMSDAVNLRVTGEALASCGYVVQKAGDLGSAVDRAKEYTPDVLIVGHQVGGVSGHDAALRLRRICPGLPVLMLGGVMDDDRLTNRETLQGFGIFPKPFTAADLLDKVREELSKSSLRRRAA